MWCALHRHGDAGGRFIVRAARLNALLAVQRKQKLHRRTGARGEAVLAPKPLGRGIAPRPACVDCGPAESKNYRSANNGHVSCINSGALRSAGAAGPKRKLSDAQCRRTGRCYQRGPRGAWLHDRGMDVAADRQADPATHRFALPSRPCLEGLALARLQLPAPQSARHQAHRAADCALETGGVGVHQKSPEGGPRTVVFIDEIGLGTRPDRVRT